MATVKKLSPNFMPYYYCSVVSFNICYVLTTGGTRRLSGGVEALIVDRNYLMDGDYVHIYCST